MRGVVGNLLEKYWFLDSFGADLGWGESGDGQNRDLTNLDLAGRSWEIMERAEREAVSRRA